MNYSVTQNNTWCIRTGTITVEGQTFTVIQNPTAWDLGVDYNTSGVWQFDPETSIWASLAASNPQKMVMGGTTLYADFKTGQAAVGVYKYDCGWTGISANDPQDIICAGSLLFGDFGTWDNNPAHPCGVYKYLGTPEPWRWKGLASSDPGVKTTSPTKFYAWFPALVGLYEYTDVSGDNVGTWTVLTPNAPDQIAADATYFYGDFGTKGFYRYSTATGWKPLASANAENFALLGTSAYADFGTLGFYRWNGTVLSRISTLNATGLMTAAGTNLYVNFTAGLYQWNGAAWTKIDNRQASVMGTCNNKLVAGFGDANLYEYNGSAWSQIHSGHTAQQAVDLTP